MTNKQLHQLNCCLIALMVFIFLLLCVFQFVVALLWLLLCGLAISMLARRNHPLYCVERDIWNERAVRIRSKRQKKKQALYEEMHYQNEFVPDRMLVGIGDHAGERYFIEDEVFVIGTKKKCQCVLSGEQAATISGEHCRITYRKHSRTYYIEDLYSLNGTYLGSKRLEPRTPEKLLDNAEISIGHVRFCFVKRN